MTRTNEEQLDLFADLLEPVGDILTDKELFQMLQSGEKLKAIKMGIKNHKQAVIQILALIDGEDIGTYTVPSPAVLAMKILGLFNDPNISALFMPQGQSATVSASGSVTENTEASEN